MIIIGELINASRRVIKEAIEKGDAGVIRETALSQAAAGADFIDVNAGIFVDGEAGYLRWLVETVQEATDLPCALDSPSPEAIAHALEVHRGAPMINSISLESQRYDALLPLVAGTDCRVIALCMSDHGMPVTVDDRLAIADKLVNGLVKNNVPIEHIFVDPLVQPVSTNRDYGMEFLDAIEQIVRRFPGVKTACGLSNISYGLPERKILNRTFMTMAICKGLSGAIVNPLDRKMMATIIVAETLAGRDDFCMNYLGGYRAGKLEGL